MIHWLIGLITGQIIDNLLLPPVALGFEVAEAVSDHADDARQETA